MVARGVCFPMRLATLLGLLLACAGAPVSRGTGPAPLRSFFLRMVSVHSSRDRTNWRALWPARPGGVPGVSLARTMVARGVCFPMPLATLLGLLLACAGAPVSPQLLAFVGVLAFAVLPGKLALLHCALFAHGFCPLFQGPHQLASTLACKTWWCSGGITTRWGCATLGPAVELGVAYGRIPAFLGSSSPAGILVLRLVAGVSPASSAAEDGRHL